MTSPSEPQAGTSTGPRSSAASPPTGEAAHAFEVGDFAALRLRAAKGTALEPRERAAASVDPAMTAALAACALAFVAVAAWYLR